MAIRITCITKASGDHENSYVAITSLGWINESNETGSSTRLVMYDWSEKGGQAYVKGADGSIAYLITAISAKGLKYVKTKADSTTSDNLLKLKEC